MNNNIEDIVLIILIKIAIYIKRILDTRYRYRNTIYYTIDFAEAFYQRK